MKVLVVDPAARGHVEAELASRSALNSFYKERVRIMRVALAA